MREMFYIITQAGLQTSRGSVTISVASFPAMYWRRSVGRFFVCSRTWQGQTRSLEGTPRFPARKSRSLRSFALPLPSVGEPCPLSLSDGPLRDLFLPCPKLSHTSSRPAEKGRFSKADSASPSLPSLYPQTRYTSKSLKRGEKRSKEGVIYYKIKIDAPIL